jgi:putative hemolysin
MQFPASNGRINGGAGCECVLALLLLACGCTQPQAGTTATPAATQTQASAGMPKPHPYTAARWAAPLRLKTDATGGQYGMCTFANGTSCEEWALYRGEGCNAGQNRW